MPNRDLMLYIEIYSTNILQLCSREYTCILYIQEQVDTGNFHLDITILTGNIVTSSL